jgi:hypothetical protein
MLVQHRTVEPVPLQDPPAVTHGQRQSHLFVHGHAAKPGCHCERGDLRVRYGVVADPGYQCRDFATFQGSAVALLVQQLFDRVHGGFLAVAYTRVLVKSDSRGEQKREWN